MIVVGLFNGLVLLPTALSIICPEPYTHYTKIEQIKSEHANGTSKLANGVSKQLDKKQTENC